MRSALLCVFFTLIIQRGRIRADNDDDFRPTPIPLNEWHHEIREGRAGTLHETFKTDSPPSIAAVPAHYWEDALRHSVYLTLVRDKIDQLIAKGDVISPNSKPDSYDSKEIDDHDLWDKIKTAPFDRIQEEEPASFGDVTIMAKGRLLQDKNGFRFSEDERTKEKCSREKCMDGVKAFWSVKRIRQRDQETSAGKYHYELTFSVISQMPKKHKKPHENPIRTFTVKESSTQGIMDRSQEHRRFDPIPIQTTRPERAIWVHKNIAPSKSFTGRKSYVSSFDRIFSSFFSDDENSSYETPPSKYKSNSYPGQTGSQYSKIGHVGVAVDKHQVPYPYRQHPVQHARPPLQAPPTNQMQHHFDVGSYTTANSNPYAHYSYDHRVELNQPVKTTRPAVLPTPLPPVLPSKDQSTDMTNTMSLESTAYTPNVVKMQKPYNKYKSTPVKVNYLSEHVRPPVYNAPPGVFVTMDKKPFKPMPPLKLVQSSKPHRPNKPIDFRPSPQILDQNSDQDSFSDTAFRPITMTYGENSSSESSEFSSGSKKSENKNRKTIGSGKKPSKKHENIRPHRITTAAPDIITVQSTSDEEIETMDWTNVLGAFTKTTPMVSQTEKMVVPETTTPMTTTVTVTTPKKIVITTEPYKETTISASTTHKPKKRTRPPPKFVKQEKIKKHKRITTTTTTTTTTNAPESKKRPLLDLTPQASSAATGSMKPFRSNESVTKANLPSIVSTVATTTTTTTKPTTTKLTTTTQTPTTTVKKVAVSTTQPKNKNRFRQSTLMYKGTSVKHDRWNSIGMQKNATTAIPSSVLHRRKGSNFQGYISSTTPRQIDDEREKNIHADRKQVFSNIKEITTKTPDAITQSSPNYEETADQYESNSVLPIVRSQETNADNKNHNSESKDRTEYIFQSTTTPFYEVDETSTIEKSMEVDPTPYTQAKNKTKCKKKKNNHSTTEEPTDADFDTITTVDPSSTTTKTSSELQTTSDILDELFNFDFKSKNDKTSDLDKEESFNHESYSKVDTDFDFLGVLHDKKEHRSHEQSDYEYESDDDTDDSNEDNNYDEESEESRIHSIDDDDDDDEFESDEDIEDNDETVKSLKDNKEKKRSYSFLELMAMS